MKGSDGKSFSPFHVVLRACFLVCRALCSYLMARRQEADRLCVRREGPGPLSPVMFTVAIPASQIRDRFSSTSNAFLAQHNRRSSITRGTRCTSLWQRERYNITFGSFQTKTQLAQGRLANVLLFLDNVGTRAILVVYYD